MAQFAKLVSAFDGNLALSFVVGAADIVAHRLYKQDAAGLLVIAGDNEVVPLFVPTTAEKAGYRVQAVPLGLGTFTLTGSGAIAAGAKLSSAADGKVKTAAAGDPIVTSAYNAAADGELLSVVPAGPAIAGASIIASGTVTLVDGIANGEALPPGPVKILLTRQAVAGTPGYLSVAPPMGPAPFTVSSSSATDTSIVDWIAVR